VTKTANIADLQSAGFDSDCKSPEVISRQQVDIFIDF
jgi:hypothetical protein